MIKKIKEYLSRGKTRPHLFQTFFIYGFIALSIIITKVLIARLYGQAELGIFSYFFGLVTVLFLFTSFGFPDALTQTIVRKPAALKDALIKSLFFIILPTFIFLLPFLFFPSLLAAPGLKINLVLYILTYTFFYFTYSLFRGYRKFAEGSFYSLINRLLFILFIILCFFLALDFSLILFALSLALLLTGFISLPRLFHLTPRFPLIEKVNTKEFLSLAFSLFLMQAGFYLLREADLIIIPYLVNFTSLGLYSAHSSIINIIRLIAYVFPVVMLPMAALNRYQLKTSFSRIFKWLLPFSFVVLFAAYLFVPLLYGPEYQNAFLPLALTLSSFLLVLYSFFNSIFVGENKFSPFYFKIIVLDFLLSLIVNTLLNIYFILKFGLIGAPLALSLTVIIKILLNLYALKKLRLENKQNGPLPA